jgi:vitamin B12/bleomycin/antimicrobial peptide transport system ATP-binding/permease protein
LADRAARQNALTGAQKARLAAALRQPNGGFAGARYRVIGLAYRDRGPCDIATHQCRFGGRSLRIASVRRRLFRIAPRPLFRHRRFFVKGLASTLATIWRLAIPYFRSEDRWPARILLGAVIALQLAMVGLQVVLNEWNNRFYNTLQNYDWNGFISAILFFCGIVAVYTVIGVYQIYLNQWLQIRWRRWMTQTYLQQWLDTANHYRMQLLGDAADNPDQRIAEDIRLFIDSGAGFGVLPIGLGLLNSVVTILSFIAILWNLSEAAPLKLFGVAIHGYLVWAALLYAIFGTVIAHLIGRPLIPLNFAQQRLEADFRFNLVRTRENSEQIASLHGEAAERERHLGRFVALVGNWYALMQRQKKLLFFTQSYAQASVVFPYLMVSPVYFSRAMQLGGLMQTASAFARVQDALSYFVDSYRNIAEFQAIVARLAGFQSAIAAGRAAAVTPPVIEAVPRAHADAIASERLSVALPDGTTLINAQRIAIDHGERVLVTGPSGVGKSTLFRAIAGIWPFGDGRITVPTDAKVMLLPQRPYFPLASLAIAITYPAVAGTYDDARLADAVTAVGLPGLVPRLGEEAHWNRMLSVGEQQRLAIARALLQVPDYLLLDEATSALDEPAEAMLYRLLLQRLPAATIVSIGHRSTLGAFHRRRLAFVREPGGAALRDVPLTAAAE